MTQTILWGTALNDGAVQRRRCTSDYHTRVTSDGDTRVVQVLAVDLLFYRKTSAGDRRVTSEGDRRLIASGAVGPRYYATAAVTTDGDEAFAFLFETNDWQPDAQGGESLFSWAYITLSWSMAATVRITPVIDGSSASVTLPDGAIMQTITPIFQLEQQSGSYQRVSQVFAVPLARAMVRDGVEVTRVYQRGQRLRLTIESTGPLGVGELMLEGIEVEVEPVRKSIYATVDAS